MEAHGMVAVLSLAFGLGLLHALDADHVMAVSGLASSRPGLRTSLAFCARWAVGHGLSLVMIGSAVLLLGVAVPTELSAVAESLVGVALIAIGAWVLWTLAAQGIHLHFHRHEGLPRHAHWHKHDFSHNHERNVHRHGHGTVMVGVLHGTAGSAPLLALIPLAQIGSPWIGLAYLALFSGGVLVSMLLFGGLLGCFYSWLLRWGGQVVNGVRAAVALSAVGFGGHLLVSAL